MHECVEEAEEGAVPAWGEFDSEPDGHWHDAMMDDVERADLIILFSQNEKKLLSNKYRKLFVKFPSRLLTVSMNSVNFEKKYHHEACTILSVLGLFE
jgi:hypothetical protein